ncbi:MAG: hypothetical protein ACEQSX_18365 [Baekduiaceae bacterium]
MTPAEHASAPAPPERLARRVSQIVIFVTVVVLAVGAAAQLAAIDALGTAASPLVGEWEFGARWWGVAVAGIAAVATVWVGPRLLAVRWHPAAVALALYVLAVALGLALNVVRDGTDGWTRMFDLGPSGSFEAPNEYLPALPSLGYGVWFYLDRFAEMVPAFPVHVAGHPPGPLLLLHAFGITTAGGMAALVVLGGSLCAPLAYRLGWTLHGEPAGRVAGLVCACSPLMLLFGVSSFDYVFAAAGGVAACLLAARAWRRRLLGALVLGSAVLLNWALLAVGAWAALVVWRRDGWRPAVLVAAACGAGLVVVNGALAIASGYDPIGTIRATEQVYRDSIAQVRPYWFWVLGSPVAWGVTLGVPIAAGAIRAAVARTSAGVALAAVVAIAALGGFSKAETERIWLFLVPLACAAAAPYLHDRRLRWTMGLLLAQALLMQVLMDTVW